MITSSALGTISLFAALPEPARRILAQRAVERRYRAGQTLFRAGDAPAGLMVVLEGRVRVVREAGRRAQVVHVERAGGTLGEVPVFAGGVYPATAVATEPTRCAVIDRATIAAAVAASPEVAFALLERLANRVREIVARLDRSALHPVAGRLAAFLAARAESRGRSIIALGMTQQQLAEELGTVREVIVRELKAMRDRGVIRALGGGRFEIVDAAALRELAQGETAVRDGTPASSRDTAGRRRVR